MARRRGELRVGTSGYQYDHWRRRFYPASLPKSRWLDFYARHFDAVEVNTTFYGLPKAETVARWRDAVPPGFRFALKFSRFGTHVKRLRDPEEPIARFLEVAEELGARLGPVLVQLPPHWHPHPERLDAFLAAAPRRHRWAVELRDPEWLCDEVLDVLRRRRAALCLHDALEDHPHVLTTDWSYLRFHGSAPGHAGGYSPQKLSAEARRIRGWLARGVDVHVYFNNDRAGHAVADARTLRRYLG
jgi:uncharacterized protein YecE (DUF72 family)